MADTVEFDEIINMHHLIGHAILTAMGDVEGDLREKFHLGPDKAPVQVSLLINGVEAPLRPFFEHLESEYSDMVNKGVAGRILQQFGERYNALDDLLRAAEQRLRDELRLKGFLFEDH